MTLKPASKQFSLRLTHKERAQLENEAGNLSLSVYVRSRLFCGDVAPRKMRGKTIVKDHTEIGRVLALLGASNIAAHLSKLAKAAETGSLPVTPDTESAIKAACSDIRAMRAALMKALGFRNEDRS